MRKSYSLSTIALLICSVRVSAQDQNVPVAPAAGAAAPIEKSLIRLHVQAGQTYLMRLTMDTKMTELMPQSKGKSGTGAALQRMDVVSTNTSTMSCVIAEVDAAGLITMQVTYEAMQLKSSSKMGNHAASSFTYDSTHPAKGSALIAAGLKGFLGQQLIVKVTPDGRVTDVQVAKNFATALDPNPHSDDTLKDFSGSLGGNLNVKSLIATMKRMTFGRPVNPVGVGDSWTEKVSASSQSPGNTIITRTLRDHKNGLWYIDEKSSTTMDTAQQVPVPSQSGIKMDMQMTGNQTGSIELDEATGFIQKSQSQGRFAGKMTMSGLNRLKGAASQPAKTVIPIYSKSTTMLQIEAVKSAGATSAPQ